MDFNAAIDEQLAKRGVQAAAVEEYGRTEKKRKGLHPMLLAGPVAGAMADAYTTDKVFDYARDKGLRAYEKGAFPESIADNPAALYGTKGAVGLGISGAAELLARKGGAWRDVAKVLAVLGTAGQLGLAAHNLRELERAKKQK